MGYRKKVFYITGVSICGFLAGILLANLREAGICGTPFCRDIIGDMIGVPVGFFSMILFTLSFILLFTREAVFYSWKKFAIVYLPIAAILLFLTAGESGGGIGFAAIDGEIISWWLAGLFLSISLLIIGSKSWKLRGK